MYPKPGITSGAWRGLRNMAAVGALFWLLVGLLTPWWISVGLLALCAVGALVLVGAVMVGSLDHHG